MQLRAKRWQFWGFAPLLAIFLLLGSPQQAAFAQNTQDFSQQELDQMLAPIALYPDALLSQVLMASTYPLEVVEAERWSVANPRLHGWQAAQAVQGNNWDPSIKSLVAFPQVLRMMSSKLSWTERLGDAFLGQEDQVMDTVQSLRHRADVAGNLRSNALMRVDSQGEYINIYQADPLLAYEPYYNASVVYGSWWWPQSPPVYWAPWAGYSARPGFGNGFLWGAGITLSAQYFFGNFDWRQRHVNVVNVQNSYIVRDTRYAPLAPRDWQHAPAHRRGAPYRAPATRAKFAESAKPAAQRNDFRGHLQPGSSALPPGSAPPTAGRPGAGKPEQTRPVAAPGVHPAVQPPAPADVRDKNRPATQPVKPADRPRGRTASRPEVQPASAPRTPAAQAPVAPPHALENIGQGAAERKASERGRNSRQFTTPAAPVQRPAPAARPVAATPQAAPARAAPPAAAPPRPPAPAPARAAPAPKPAAEQRGQKGKGREEK